jgi:Icc-related predicted phosphoesterase
MKVTLISDTHTKHKIFTNDLPGGDLLIHAGDISSMGYEHEIGNFCKWYDSLNNYTHKIFIAGNHDWGFQNNIENVNKILDEYKNIEYIEDQTIGIGTDNDQLINVYGSPWQPEFYNWAFNLPKNGLDLFDKWENIPGNTDILVTHGPAFGYLDDVEGNRGVHLGCELLTNRIKTIKPKIHVCGHIHSGHGYYFDGVTHFFNASVLDERYHPTQDPFTFDWNPDTNEINFS